MRNVAFKQSARATLWMTNRAARWPGVGSYAAPVGAAAAVGLWGAWQAPAVLRGLRVAGDAGSESETPPAEAWQTCAAALRDISGDAEDVVWPEAARAAPVVEMMRQRRRYLHASAVPYGAARGQLLDVWRSPHVASPSSSPAPVMVFVPGGAWLHGSRKYQGHAVMSHLCELGWVCVSIDYRVSPTHRWPRHVQDVKAAVAWTRAHAEDIGADPTFVAVLGCSAGGHLAALAGLTPGDPDFDAELDPRGDASVDAVVSLYGRYDWEDRSSSERDWFVNFLETLVVQRDYHRHRALFRAASPVARVTEEAPPFLIVHGSRDSVIPVQQARDFVTALRSVSHEVVSYVELAGAQHGFDLHDGVRTGAVCVTVGHFLAAMHARHRDATQASASP